ncbi:SDR family NAD(P)-dependent oxidoreductase [Amycolatopsis sp.]|uniref:SDR family NAD(P)-dependent oxidoreductase n=1 Tax=Amycolatopsis sp. TaxID=37632 RepID=UPI002CD862B2|nr:SDR family oxidoreductase [Amycolatopsis sp.]HVV12700.1 SDR family oxidoreductase [Amycolatopsis sp.]
MPDFAGQVALVTGGGKGIGRAISLELARRGADVAINYRSDADAAAETADEIRGLGRRALLLPADITDPGAAEALVPAVRAGLGPVRLLVNNAAYTRLMPPDELGLRTWRRIFAANVDAAFQLTWLVRADMREHGGGAVVNISSTSSLKPDPATIAYGASKAALNAFTASAALALVRDGIRINAVAPGFTRTPRVDTVDPATRAAMLAGVPMGRLAEAGEIAAVVAFLLSEQASYVTGQVVTAAGGP